MICSDNQTFFLTEKRSENREREADRDRERENFSINNEENF